MSKKMVGIVLGGSAFAILLCCGGGYAVYRAAMNAGVTEETYNSLPLGAAEAETATKLPEKYEVPANEVYPKDDQSRSGMPAGATCRHYATKDQPSNGSTRLQVYRFCFAGGKLVEKKLIPAAGAR